jgi:hypothetical protein
MKKDPKDVVREGYDKIFGQYDEYQNSPSAILDAISA